MIYRGLVAYHIWGILTQFLVPSVLALANLIRADSLNLLATHIGRANLELADSK